jgi:hypothetical protein
MPDGISVASEGAFGGVSSNALFAQMAGQFVENMMGLTCLPAD